MQLSYAARLQCDACGVEADVPPRSMDDLFEHGTSGPLPGWGLPRGWGFNHAGTHRPRLNELCPDCMVLPFANVLAMVARRAEQRQAAAGAG